MEKKIETTIVVFIIMTLAIVTVPQVMADVVFQSPDYAWTKLGSDLESELHNSAENDRIKLIQKAAEAIRCC